jgi:uncharacterized protein (DUF983 family)
MSAAGKSGALRGIAKQVCPRRREGAMVRGPLWRTYLAMHEKCPVCGLKYEREPGYFLGAMYFSYLLSLLPGLAIVLLLWRWSGWPFDTATICTFFCYLPLVPAVTLLALRETCARKLPLWISC